MLWLNILHLYQPAHSDGHIIKEATEKSYYRIVRALEEHPKVKFTLNISGCLFLRWEELGYQDLIRRLARLLRKGRIEVTGTAAYHPIIPLVPKQEAIRQIKSNEKILHKYFGAGYKPAGFFLPELAYSSTAARLVKRFGYRWLVLDEIASGALDAADTAKVYRDRASGLKIVLRHRKYSNSYVPKTVERLLDENKAARAAGKPEKNDFIMTTTDAELYGLRYIDQTAVFEKILGRASLATQTVSEYVGRQTSFPPIEPPAHNWNSTPAELAAKNPFLLWSDKNNTIQKKIWQLAELAFATIEKSKQDKNFHWARWHLVRGLSSCTFWWASARDFRLFGPISWSPDEIERGTNELVRAIRALDDEKTREAKMQAEKLYVAIKKMVWQRHWAYYWKKS